MLRLALLALLTALPLAVRADPPRIVGATAERSGMGWKISVTIRHDDTGWHHFADGWEVRDTAGNRLGYRKLGHPHVAEQPFTRSLNSVMIPDGQRKVLIRAHCSTGAWSTEDYKLVIDK